MILSKALLWRAAGATSPYCMFLSPTWQQSVRVKGLYETSYCSKRKFSCHNSKVTGHCPPHPAEPTVE